MLDTAWRIYETFWGIFAILGGIGIVGFAGLFTHGIITRFTDPHEFKVWIRETNERNSDG